MEILDKVYDYSVCWQMSPHERMATISLLESLSPRFGNLVSIEVGTYCGGCLRHIEAHSYKTLCVDIDFTHLCKPKEDWKDVEFVQGDSRELLKNLPKKFTEFDFALVDGNHEYDFVLQDVQNLVNSWNNDQDSIILVHDSWYPPSRRALMDVRYSSNVQFVDLDFCSGTILENGTCVGGLALIKLSQTHRTSELEIRQSDFRGYKKMSGVR